jgi:hypothetical protein
MKVLFFLTVLLLFGVGLVFAQTDRQEVMAHWDQRRCDLSVLIASNLYKPPNDSRSSVAFATENLKFCTNKIIQETFTVALNPYLASLGEQIKLVKTVQDVMANVKEMIGNFFNSFTKIFDSTFQRFIAIGFNFRKTFVLFMTAMNRAFGIAMSSVFAGMSMLVGIQNFYDAVIKIVMIVIGILAGLVIILFLAFFPVIPIIMTTIGVLVAGGVGAAAGFSGVFCFAPNTEIQTMRGLVPMSQVKLGDRLADGGVIEGILNVNGAGTDIYTLQGIHVSGDHLVFYEPLAKWILVKEHPDARKEIRQEPVLICLNTSTREIPIQGLRFRDWEEIPSDRPDIQKGWNELVASLLSTKGVPAAEADEYPLFNGAWFVQTQEGKVALRDVQMGMKILDHDGSWTRVLGIYEGEESTTGNQGSFWHTDSIWWKGKDDSWFQKPVDVTKKTAIKQRGFHLVTGSGTFRIFDNMTEYGVRDFTEVGQARIAETYEWMKARL